MAVNEKPARVRIPLRDQMWLRMDRRENLMYINSLIWFEEKPDWDAVIETVDERMIRRYPVFRRRLVRDGVSWFWEDVPDFDVRDHFTLSHLGGAGDKAAAEAHVSARMSDVLDPDRPLWEAELIDGLRLRDGVEGGLILFRVQHGVVDGVRLTQLLLDLCDHEEGSTPPRVGVDLTPVGESSFDKILRIGQSAAFDAVDIARQVTSATVRFPSTVARVVRDVAAPGRELLRIPVRTIESLSTLADEKNTAANTFRAISRIVLDPGAPKLAWSGRAGVDKRVSWIGTLPLESVKSAAHTQDSTVTAVILAGVSMGITEYLRWRGDTVVADINLLVPISLRPLTDDSSDELGNHVTLIMLRLPLGIDDPEPLLASITEMMNRVKHSFEPHLTYSLTLAIGAAPGPLIKPLVDYFAGKAAGQLTSVPGPQTPVRLAGTQVAGMLGWVPMSGDQSLGICIFSYNGYVSVGFATDANLIPDPAVMARFVEESFTRFPGWSAD